MERVEIFRGMTFMLRTHQLGPERWSCDVFGRESADTGQFVLELEDFGDSELEAIAMALSEVHYHH